MRIGLVGRADQIKRARTLAANGVGVLFTGEPGIGKTRLLSEVLASLESGNWHTERFVASTAGRRMPFGALISLLPAGGGDRRQQFAGVRQALRERAGGLPTALAIDDAHLLDDDSLACLVDLVHQGDIVFLGTARSTEPTPSDLMALWAGDAVERLDIGPLDHAETAALTRHLLAGPVSPELAAQVWERTRGVPLLVRELVLDAATQGLLVEDAGSWLLHGDLRTGARLQELIGARLASLTGAARALLEVVAVGEPLAVDLLDPAEGTELDGLERRGLASCEQLAGRWVVRVDHPLVAEVITSDMSTRRRLALLRDVVQKVSAAADPAPGDALRLAAWHEECGDPLPPRLALAAGHEALASLAFERACELARAALEDLPRAGHLLLGQALRLQAQATEAEAALAVGANLAEDDETIVRVAMWRSTLRAHHADDPVGALELLHEAADQVSSSSRALELRSEAAFLSGLLQGFDVAVDTNRQILAAGGLDPAARWTALMNLLLGQVMLADVDSLDETIAELAGLLEAAGPARPEGVDLYWALVGMAHMLRGDLARCEDDLVPHVQRCAAEGHLHGITATLLVHPLVYRGSPHAQAMAAAGGRATERIDTYLMRPVANAGQAIAQANAGDLDQAEAALVDVEASHDGDRRLEGFVGRARGAVLALRGLRDEAAELVAGAGRRCVAETYVLTGAGSMYDAVRYGRADLVADDLARLAGPDAAPLVDAFASHAVAQRDGDERGLLETADTLASIGAHALVAEALDDAARAAPDTVTAGRSASAAALWRRKVPAPSALARPVDPPLTERELEVVEHALRGHSSKEIARALFLSVRTVDNHLAGIYRKLVISGRAALPVVLTPAPPTG